MNINKRPADYINRNGDIQIWKVGTLLYVKILGFTKKCYQNPEAIEFAKEQDHKLFIKN